MNKKEYLFSSNDGLGLFYETILWKFNSSYFEVNPEDTQFSLFNFVSDDSKIYISKNANVPDLYQDREYIEYETYGDIPKCEIVVTSKSNGESRKIKVDEFELIKKYNIKNQQFIDVDQFNIYLGLEKLADNGEMIIHASASLLSKNDIASASIRKYLIDNKLIKGVVLTKSVVGKNEYDAFLYITKCENKNIVFVDAKNNDYMDFYEAENSFGGSETFMFKQIPYRRNDFFRILRLGKKSYGVSEVIKYAEVIDNNYSLNVIR